MKRGLGRGLDSLFGSLDDENESKVKEKAEARYDYDQDSWLL